MIELEETKPGYWRNTQHSVIEVSDISKFTYGIKNAYRTKSPVKSYEKRFNRSMYVENEAGKASYFDIELFEWLSTHENVKLFLSSRDGEENQALFGVFESKRIAIAPYEYTIEKQLDEEEAAIMAEIEYEQQQAEAEAMYEAEMQAQAEAEAEREAEMQAEYEGGYW